MLWCFVVCFCWFCGFACLGFVIFKVLFGCGCLCIVVLDDVFAFDLVVFCMLLVLLFWVLWVCFVFWVCRFGDFAVELAVCCG